MNEYTNWTSAAAAPGANTNTTNLFTTVGGWGTNYAANHGIHRIITSIQCANPGTLKWYRSADAGATWTQMGSKAVAATYNTATSETDIAIAGCQDFKIDWVNGGSAQSTWSVAMAAVQDAAFTPLTMPGMDLVTTITQTSPTSATTEAGTESSSALDLSAYDDLLFILTSAASAAGTLDVYVQDLLGGTYYDYHHFEQIAAATAIKKAGHAALTGETMTIGSGTTPALAAGKNRGGRWGKQMRLCITAGAGATAPGAAVSCAIYGRLKRA